MCVYLRFKTTHKERGFRVSKRTIDLIVYYLFVLFRLEMPKRIVNNLERVLIIAFIWLLIELNPIVSQNLELQRVGSQEAMTSSSHSSNSYKSPITRIVFSLAAEQQQQLNQNSSDSSSSSSKFINEQSRLFKRLLQQTTTSTTTRKTTRTKLLATTKQTATTTTRRKYLENELMMASNTKINDHDDEEDEYYSQDYSEMNSSGETRQQQQSNEVVNNRCRPKPIEMSLDLRSCGRVTLPTTECRGYCPSGEQMLASKLKKQTCWACKPHRYVYKNYKIRCMDNSIMNLRLKTIDACSCFKHSEKIIPL